MANKQVPYRISADDKNKIKFLAAEYGNGMSNRFISALCQYVDTGEPIINDIRIEDCLQDIIGHKLISGRLSGKILQADQVFYQNFKAWMDNEDEGFGNTLLNLICPYQTISKFLSANPKWIVTVQEQYLAAENGNPLRADEVTRYLTQWYTEKEKNGENRKALAEVIRRNRAARLREEE